MTSNEHAGDVVGACPARRHRRRPGGAGGIFTDDVRRGRGPVDLVAERADRRARSPRRAFSDIELDVVPLDVGGDYACVEWTVEMTHTGRITLADHTTRAFRHPGPLHGVTVAEFDGERLFTPAVLGRVSSARTTRRAFRRRLVDALSVPRFRQAPSECWQSRYCDLTGPKRSPRSQFPGWTAGRWLAASRTSSRDAASRRTHGSVRSHLARWFDAWLPGEFELDLVLVTDLDLDLQLDFVGHRHRVPGSIAHEFDLVVACELIGELTQPSGGRLAAEDLTSSARSVPRSLSPPSPHDAVPGAVSSTPCRSPALCQT